MRVVPTDEAEGVKAERSRATEALLSGQVIHYPDARAHLNYSHLRAAHGVRLRSRSDDAGGRYYWIEPL